MDVFKEIKEDCNCYVAREIRDYLYDWATNQLEEAEEAPVDLDAARYELIDRYMEDEDRFNSRFKALNVIDAWNDNQIICEDLVAVLSDSGVDSRYLEDIVAGALRYAGVNAFAVDRGRIVIDEF